MSEGQEKRENFLKERYLIIINHSYVYRYIHSVLFHSRKRACVRVWVCGYTYTYICLWLAEFFEANMLGITEVIENLYISGLESRQAIVGKGIRSVINISSECPVQDLGPNIEYEKVSLLDLPTTSIQPYFDRLTDRIHQNLQQGKKTLVHCYVGRSRSATIILGKNIPQREEISIESLQSREMREQTVSWVKGIRATLSIYRVSVLHRSDFF